MMPLISSQHFPVWVALQMSVWVRLHDLTSAKHVWLSVRMSVAVSMSMNESSSFEESCPSNMGISWEHGHGEVWFSLGCVQGVCVCLHHFVHWFLTRLGGKCGWSIIVKCCSLSESWGLGSFKLANWSLSCWNCSNSSVKGLGVSVFFTVFIRWFIVSLCHRVFWWHKIQGAESWVAGTSSMSLLPYLVAMVCVMQHVPRCLAEISWVIFCSFQTCAYCSGSACYRRWKSLTRQWLWWACWVVHLLCRSGASQSSVDEIQSVTGERLMCLLAGIFDCSTVSSLVMAPV